MSAADGGLIVTLLFVAVAFLIVEADHHLAERRAWRRRNQAHKERRR